MKRRKPEESESGGSWLDTYADMITLVLVFFVLLFSFSTIDAQKWREIMNSLNMMSEPTGELIQTGEFVSEITQPGYPTMPSVMDTPSPDSAPTPAPPGKPSPSPTGTPEKEPEYFDELYIKISNYIEREDLETKVFVLRQKNGILLRFTENVLFDSGRAYLLGSAKETLEAISLMLHELLDDLAIVRVEGHTDDRPINTSVYPSNWELSAARALAVVRYLAEVQQLEPSKFSAVAYGEYAPIVENDSEESRQKNRRVDIFIEGKDK